MGTCLLKKSLNHVCKLQWPSWERAKRNPLLKCCTECIRVDGIATFSDFARCILGNPNHLQPKIRITSINLFLWLFCKFKGSYRQNAWPFLPSEDIIIYFGRTRAMKITVRNRPYYINILYNKADANKKWLTRAGANSHINWFWNPLLARAKQNLWRQSAAIILHIPSRVEGTHTAHNAEQFSFVYLQRANEATPWTLGESENTFSNLHKHQKQRYMYCLENGNNTRSLTYMQRIR
jgi:hypothetical protein